jgi:iron complex outermembrane receptor protein
MKASFISAANRTFQITTALGLVTALAPATAFAQQAGTEPTTGPQVGPGAAPTSAVQAQSPSAPRAGLADIIVTARRSAENVQRVPIAISTVTAQTLKDLSVRDVLEIQKVTPGLYISSQNSAGRVKLEIRGQSEADSRLSTDGSVGVYIDGVNIVRDYGLRSNMVDLAQVEVLKGPQGTLFGKNTTGGALNITTQHPTYEFGGYVDGTYGSYNNRQILGVINIPIVDDKLAIRLVGQRIKRDGFGHAGNGQDVGDDDVWFGRALIRADPTDNLHILLSGDYVRQNTNGTNVILTNNSMLQNANSAKSSLGEIAAELGLNPNSAADRLTAYNKWLTYFNRYANQYNGIGVFNSGFNNENLFDNMTHYGFSGTVSYDLGGITAKSITAYRHLTHAYNQDLDGTPFAIQQAYTHTREHNFSQEFQLSSIHGHGLDWQVGLYYNRELGNELSISNTNNLVNLARASIAPDADIKNTSKAAYAQAVYNFTSKFRITGGIRYTEDYRGLDAHNRQDPGQAAAFNELPVPPAANALCFTSIGGVGYPNCNFATSTKSHKITWLASADWRPISQAMLYVSASRGYRAGGFSIQSPGSAPANANALEADFTPFLPEIVTSYEVGVKSDLLDRRLRINADFYYEDYTDIQQQIRDEVNNTVITLIRNAAKAKPYGAELEVTGQITRHWTINGGASYLHATYESYFARDASGNLLNLSNLVFPAPKWTYDIGTSYVTPVPYGELRANLNFNYTAKVDFRPGTPTESSVTQPKFGLLDGRIAWNIDRANVNIALFGKNLTNKKYLNAATNLQSLGYNVGFPGDPRTVGIQVRKTF